MSNTSESQIAEYQAAQECYLHYDSFRWQAGSLLIAGAFVFWGLLFTTEKLKAQAPTIALLSLLLALLMTVWILFAHHYRQIYLYKLHRILQLEEALGMLQHRRFADGGQYLVFGIKGHYLDLALYILVSLGGPFIGTAVARYDQSYLLTVVVVLAGSLWFLLNERRVKTRLKNLPPDNFTSYKEAAQPGNAPDDRLAG